MTLDQGKQKYASVLDLIKKSNVRLDHLNMQGDKLVMQGAAPNDAIKNAAWNAIKAVEPTFGDLSADISVDSSLPAPANIGLSPGARPSFWHSTFLGFAHARPSLSVRP